MLFDDGKVPLCFKSFNNVLSYLSKHKKRIAMISIKQPDGTQSVDFLGKGRGR